MNVLSEKKSPITRGLGLAEFRFFIVDPRSFLVVALLLCAFAGAVHGQNTTNSGWYWMADAKERGRNLPPGVSRMVDTNGDFDYIDREISSQAYRNEARRLMLQEANHAAQELHLEDDQPIAGARIKWVEVSPFGSFYYDGLMGAVSTTNYTYRFLSGGKLDTIELENSYDVWRDLQDELLPENQVNNAAAYQLATQWLAAMSVDVAALNRDCKLAVESSPVLNYVGSGKEPIRRMFAPTYNIMWKTPDGPPGSPGAFVQLYLPDKLLIQLRIDSPKYILRPPLVFSNLAALFPGQGKIITNYPAKRVELSDRDFGQMAQEVTFITDSNQPEPKFHELPLGRWIRANTQLNPKHLSLSELMTLKRVSGPDEWGVVTFDLPVPFDGLHYHFRGFPNGMIDLGNFDDKGYFIECTLHDCEKAPDGSTWLSWNINWESPGTNEFRAQMSCYHGMDGDDFKLIGPPLLYYSSNTCRFYLDSTLFTDDGADLYAKLRGPAAKFRVEVHSLKGRLVNSISSSTTNGEINLAWDLTGLDGKKYTNNSFIGSFYVTYPDDTRSSPPVKAHFSKIGTSGD